MTKVQGKALRPELICTFMLLGVLGMDLAANYRLLLAEPHEDRVIKTAKVYFVAGTTPGGPLTFLLPPLLIWVWAALMWRIVFERKGADFIQLPMFAVALWYFLNEVVPLEQSLKDLSGKALHESLLKIFWGHIVLTFSAVASIVLSFIARPPPSRTRLEVFASSIWLGIIAFVATFYAQLFIDEKFPTVALDAIGHLLTETYVLNDLVPGLLAMSTIVAFGRLFTSGRGVRDVLFLVLLAAQWFLFLSIYQRLDTATGDKKYAVSAHKANGAFFIASGVVVTLGIVLQWGCGGKLNKLKTN